VPAVAYHAGLGRADRTAAQEAFMRRAGTVVVATVAFGMGIDKPDVRFVLHADAPDSLDAYHQEIGRAGRDGAPARAVLCYRPEDLGLRRFFAGGQVGVDQLELVAGELARRKRPVGSAELRDRTGLSQTRLDAALNQLERVGAVAVDPAGRVERLAAGADLEAAVTAAAELEEDRRRVERTRIEMLRGYAETGACRREVLLSYFGEPYQGPCRNCDTCDAGLADPAAPAESPFPIGGRVRHQAWGDGSVLRYEQDRVVVLFDRAGYRTLSLATVMEQQLLAPVDARPSRRELYEQARRLGIRGRSQMRRAELEAAVRAAGAEPGPPAAG
jgi:ATP-dependent DNA helicase RecQ